MGVSVRVRRVYADLREGKFCVRAFDGVRHLLIFFGEIFSGCFNVKLILF